MKHIAPLILCIVLFSCSSHPSSENTPKNSEAIFVLVENGGTIVSEEQEDAVNTTLNLLQQLTKLGRRHETRNSEIYIILTALPNRIAWSGTPRQLSEQAEEIKSLLVFHQSFNDLMIAFEQMEITINLTEPENVRIYYIGSTVHIPFQPINNKNKIEVKVPRELPSDLALGNFADRLTTLKIYRVHPDQDQVLQSYLASIGILKRAKSGDLDFALLGKAQTRSKIKNLL